jgi:hypothetical protein
VKTKSINPKEASLAATFYEPVYQRLRQWHHGQAIDLLCFVHETNDQVKTVLEDCGATVSSTFRAGCFAEVWELPHDTLLAGPFRSEPCGLDKVISEAIGCHDGKHSATAGVLLWGDHREQAEKRRHFQSKLLVETSARRNKGR